MQVLKKVRHAVTVGIAAALTGLLVISGFALPAQAATAEVVLTLPTPGMVDGKPVFESNKEYPLEIGYGKMGDGQQVIIQIPDGLTIPEAALDVPAGNTAVKSMVPGEGNSIVITFADPFPAGINQGKLDLKFKVVETQTSQETELKWIVDGKEETQLVYIVKEGDKPTTITQGFDKSSGWVDFGSVTVEDGKVQLDETKIAEAEITYSVKVSSAEARTVNLKDTLDEGLQYVEGSLTGTKVVRDDKGLNPTTTELTSLPAISGSSFEYDFEADANSVYTFTYKAKIDPDQINAILEKLQDQYDAVKDNENGGRYAVQLKNTATDGTNTDSETKEIAGSVAATPKPSPHNYFNKSTTLAENTPITLADDGVTLDPALLVDYTLTADLTKFADFAGTKYELSRNVVISDTLPAHTRWLADEADVVTATGITLTAAPAGTSEEDFGGNEYVGTYLLDGQKLLINVGKDTSVNAIITVKAEIVNIAGVPEVGWNVPAHAEKRFEGPSNTASFAWSLTDDPVSKNVTHSLITLKDGDGGITDQDKFSKRGPKTEVSGQPGESVNVPFTFSVGNWAGGLGDVMKSKITDYVDHSIFDVSEANLAAIEESIVVKYENFDNNVIGYWPRTDLDSTHWDLVLTDEGNLEFTFTEAFKTVLEASNIGTDKQFSVTISLPTKPLNVSQTLQITNRATYEGADNGFTYNSESTASATSFGDEMEVRKRAYDKDTDGFTNNLRAKIDGNNKLIEDTFVYRVDLIPHGTFNRMFFDVEDALPEGVTFLGFVDPQNVESGTTTGGSTYTIPGTNLEVEHVAAGNVVRINKGELNNTATLYFKIQLTEYEPNVGITNVITGSTTTITPTNDYPLTMVKQDADDPLLTIEDEEARFDLLAADKETVVLKDLRLANGGKLVTAEGKTPVVEDPGTYWVKETVAPVGYIKVDDLTEVTVTEEGGSAEVRILNKKGESPDPDPVFGNFTIKKVVTGIDEESVLADKTFGVSTTLGEGEELTEGPAFELEANGESEDSGKIELTDGSALVTILESRDDLPIDGYEFDSATLTVNGEAAEDWSFNLTEANPSVDPVEVVVTNNYVKSLEPEPKTYAIGDIVWVDTHADVDEAAHGDQGEGEFLDGVKVVLYQKNADGEFVEVAETVTADGGKYLFDELPAGEYQVEFVLTEEQAEKYEFTTPNKEGVADGLNSDAVVGDDPAVGRTTTIVLNDDNAALTKDYDAQEVKASEGVDPTWDAGVVVKPEPKPEPKLVSVGDYVWIDENEDGLQDETDTPIAGVKLQIVGPNGEPVLGDDGQPRTTTTDEKGYYIFDKLPALEEGQTYTVTIDPKDPVNVEALKGLEPTLENAGHDRGTDSSTWKSESIIPLVEDGAHDPSLDFGFIRPKVSVGDYVWVDKNRDGVQDDGEPGIPNVRLEIVDEDGNPVIDVHGKPVEPQVTDKDGKYSFDNLPAGKKYTVRIVQDDPDTQEALKPYLPTKENGTNDREKDSSTWEATSELLPNNGDRDPSLDFGFVTKTYAIGDVVWIDTNKDGLQSDDEQTLPGVTVILTDADGTEIARTETDKNGLYKFDNLEAGTYKVRFVLTDAQAELYEFTKQDAGDDVSDSDADPATGWTIEIVLDDANESLTTEYPHGTVEATQGIDPTWDAGVVLKETTPVDPESPTPVDPDSEKPVVPVGPPLGELPTTGGSNNLLLISGIGAVVLLVGLALMMSRRRTQV